MFSIGPTGLGTRGAVRITILKRQLDHMWSKVGSEVTWFKTSSRHCYAAPYLQGQRSSNCNSLSSLCQPLTHRLISKILRFVTKYTDL